GILVWASATGIGSLAFEVPAVALGDHLVEVLAPNGYPGCWPEATLTIEPSLLPTTAIADPIPVPSPDPRLLVCLTAGFIAAVIAAIRPRDDTSVGNCAALPRSSSSVNDP